MLPKSNSDSTVNKRFSIQKITDIKGGQKNEYNSFNDTNQTQCGRMASKCNFDLTLGATGSQWGDSTVYGVLQAMFHRSK